MLSEIILIMSSKSHTFVKNVLKIMPMSSAFADNQEYMKYVRP